ncbi:MAG TPA: hypothetical protein VNC18_09590 [Gemmatimonadaceae bacterium]|nr:hypothetical protein [Gemmatimonadaceae bacterium]
MRDPVRDPVRDSVRDSVRDPVRDSVRDSVRGGLANRAAPPRDRSANAADTAGSIALGSRSAAARPARSALCGAAVWAHPWTRRARTGA